MTGPRLLVRKKVRNLEVRLGEAVFVIRPLTLALRGETRARCRVAGRGQVDEALAERELSKAMLAGWRGLRDEDTGEEIPFGPCPACQVNGAATPPSVAPSVGPAGVGPPAVSCESCGGSGDSRDWAVRTWPDAIWTPLWEAGLRYLRQEETQSGN